MPTDLIRPEPVNILVVDDVEDNLTMMRMLLVQPGMDVLTAGSAPEALDVLERNEVALALLDVQMPLMDGFELAERMRRDDDPAGNIPIIFITGDASIRSRTFRGYEAGAVDFLVKPIDPQVLASKVRVFVELYRYRRLLLEKNAELQRALQRNAEAAEALRTAYGNALQEAQTDVLTGVSNRRHILQVGDAMLVDRRRGVQPLSVALLDLDHFKGINDSHGHAFGDAVLRAFCTHIGERIRPPHILGRLGGEEFLLLMPGTALAEAELVMERVHRTVQPHEGVAYTFSAGLAQAVEAEHLDAVIKRADDALYEAKRGGRDCSVTSPAPL